IGSTIIVRLVFFFSSRRRHTRWPRDWSSDVCSSDLLRNSTRLRRSCLERTWPMPSGIGDKPFSRDWMSLFFTVTRPSSGELMSRSEERRVGKECRSRWAREHVKKNEEEGVVAYMGED